MDDWMTELRRGNSDPAWDLFLGRYRRLIFAAIRHYAQDYDDVMDVFARVCESLREGDFRRLRTYIEQADHRATFSTWLVAVVRNLTIDWFRLRDGRHRLSVVAERLPPLQRCIFEHVFLGRRSHVEAYELIRTGASPTLSFRQFLSELRETYAAVTSGRRGRILAELGAPLPNDADLAEPAGEDVTVEDSERLEDALRSLSPEDRVAVQLYVVEEMPAGDVARVVGLPNAKAVYNRVYRALALLRQRLERASAPPKNPLSSPHARGRLTKA
jgi:RNA polymerase sigma factor (sigma-70 family)